MQGGLNSWFETVMNSEFTGEKISAKENALFESRMKARRLFNDVNSMPDSLKQSTSRPEGLIPGNSTEAVNNNG
jgi:hypothetical protein